MRFEEREITLKDGRQCILKPNSSEYAEQMLEYLKKTPDETDFLLRYPDEVKWTLEEEQKILDDFLENPYAIMMVAVVDGKVAGNCGIHFSNKLKTRHRAGVAIALCKEFWNLGIGTRMFEEMEKLALTKTYVQILELDFVEGNTRARALYEKMGYKITGRRPEAICLKDGTLLDEYMMQKKLSR